MNWQRLSGFTSDFTSADRVAMAGLGPTVYRDILASDIAADSGHLRGALSSIEIFIVLSACANILTEQGHDPGRDCIVESHGYAAAAGYAVIRCYAFFAVFAFLRAAEMIRTSICYPRFKVMVVGGYAGINNGKDRATNPSVEEIAIMRSFANMTVLAVGDSVIARKVVQAAVEIPGPGVH